MSFSVDDMKEWRAERGKHPPLRGTFYCGGAWHSGEKPPTMPATLDGDPQEDIRLMVSTASTCHIFDFETYKRGKLHKEYPHMLNYAPYRPGVDNVSITSVYAPPGAAPMTVHGIAAIPIIIDGYMYQVSNVFLVDMSPQVQGIFSGKFLADYKLGFSFTADGMQRVIPPPQ